MTLQERLMNEAREKLAPEVKYIDPKFKEVASLAEKLLNAFWKEQQKELDQIILHTIEQTIKEGCDVVEGMKYTEDQGMDNEMESYNAGIADTQHALRGIIKE